MMYLFWKFFLKAALLQEDGDETTNHDDSNSSFSSSTSSSNRNSINKSPNVSSHTINSNNSLAPNLRYLKIKYYCVKIQLTNFSKLLIISLTL